MPIVKLHYFTLRGIAEVPRIMLKYGNVEFEDFRMTFREWFLNKPDTPFGKLPVLEWDGVKAAQSYAIARFIANKVGLYGKDDFEQLLVDSVIELIRDLQAEIIKMFSIEDRKAVIDAFVAETLPRFLDNASKFLAENGGTYFVGDALTWADIAFAELALDLTNPNDARFTILGFKDEPRLTILKKYPLLEAHLSRIKAVPAIKKWHETRPSDADETQSLRDAIAAVKDEMASQSNK